MLSEAAVLVGMNNVLAPMFHANSMHVPGGKGITAPPMHVYISLVELF